MILNESLTATYLGFKLVDYAHFFTVPPEALALNADSTARKLFAAKTALSIAEPADEKIFTADNALKINALHEIAEIALKFKPEPAAYKTNHVK